MNVLFLLSLRRLCGQRWSLSEDSIQTRADRILNFDKTRTPEGKGRQWRILRAAVAVPQHPLVSQKRHKRWRRALAMEVEGTHRTR